MRPLALRLLQSPTMYAKISFAEKDRAEQPLWRKERRVRSVPSKREGCVMNLLKICYNWNFQFWYLGARVAADRPFVQIGPMFGIEQEAREFLEWWLSKRPNRNLYQVV